MPAVTAVVPTRNGGERLLWTVEALEQQTLRLAEIIVVDDASDDGSPARVVKRFPDVQVHRLDQRSGPSAARNAGLKRAATDLVLLVDHDIRLAADCVERLALARNEWQTVAACPRICLHPEREIVQADGAEPHFVGTLLLRNGFRKASELPAADTALVGAAPSGCLLVQREPVLAAGGFDEAIFFYFEDLELSFRLRALGHRFIVVPSARAYHDRGAGLPELAFRGRGSYPALRLGLTLRHRLFLLLVHYRVRTLLVLAPALLVYELASLAMALSRGLAMEWARAWAWEVRNAATLLQRRRRMQRDRVQPDRVILVGGPLPLAPGVVRSRVTATAVRCLSVGLNAYWRLARHLIG
jgi:GT2 family glycosyltransferase